MRYYAIKHTETGHFIGLPFGRHGRGGTYAELVDPREKPIRLFFTQTAAKNSLRWWLGGPVDVHRPYDFDGDDWEKQHQTPDPERERARPYMQIVEMIVREVSDGVHTAWADAIIAKAKGETT